MLYDCHGFGLSTQHACFAVVLNFVTIVCAGLCRSPIYERGTRKLWPWIRNVQSKNAFTLTWIITLVHGRYKGRLACGSTEYVSVRSWLKKSGSHKLCPCVLVKSLKAFYNHCSSFNNSRHLQSWAEVFMKLVIILASFYESCSHVKSSWYSSLARAQHQPKLEFYDAKYQLISLNEKIVLAKK